MVKPTQITSYPQQTGDGDYDGTFEDQGDPTVLTYTLQNNEATDVLPLSKARCVWAVSDGVTEWQLINADDTVVRDMGAAGQIQNATGTAAGFIAQDVLPHKVRLKSSANSNDITIYIYRQDPMAAPARTTELDAINTILATVGETPTTQSVLNAGSSADVVMAKQTFDEVNREVQSQGWHFNTYYDVELTPNETDHIVLGTDIARIDLDNHRAGSQDVTQRYDSGSGETRLFNKKDNDFIFENKVKARIVYLLDFIGIPQAAKHYITIRAARLFQDRMVGSQLHHQYNAVDEFRALADLKDMEGETGDHTIFDAYDVYKTGMRGPAL